MLVVLFSVVFWVVSALGWLSRWLSVVGSPPRWLRVGALLWEFALVFLVGWAPWVPSLLVVWAVVPLVVLLPWWGLLVLGRGLSVVARVVGRLFFFVVPRPRFTPFGVGSGRWLCLSPSRLAAARSSRFVWVVFPAVVSRRGGVVFRLWVWVSPPLDEGADPQGGSVSAELLFPGQVSADFSTATERG